MTQAAAVCSFPAEWVVLTSLLIKSILQLLYFGLRLDLRYAETRGHFRNSAVVHVHGRVQPPHGAFVDLARKFFQYGAKLRKTRQSRLANHYGAL